MTLITTHSITLTSDVNPDHNRETGLDSEVDTLSKKMRGALHGSGVLESVM